MPLKADLPGCLALIVTSPSGTSEPSHNIYMQILTQKMAWRSCLTQVYGQCETEWGPVGLLPAVLHLTAPRESSGKRSSPKMHGEAQE